MNSISLIFVLGLSHWGYGKYNGKFGFEIINPNYYRTQNVIKFHKPNDYTRLISTIGPKQWEKFAPVCGTGRSQSPVDLVLPSGAVDHGAITFSSAYIMGETMQGTLKNNGHSGKF